MARPAPPLAKLARPDASGLVARDRLFESLDRTGQNRLAWVSGPGGAGKTSLVASWLARRGTRVVWYRVDAGDSDPATFFHYLGIAARQADRKKRWRLGHLTPEYLAGLDDFARRYFRDFFAGLPAPCVVVFDSLHQAGDSPLEQILAWAANEVPPGMTMVCISRKTPGAPFARRAADVAFVHVNGNDLRLDDGEAHAIARTGDYGADEVPALLATAQGWTAGLVLMLRAQAHKLAMRPAAGDTQREICDYFAGEIFTATDAATRDFLMRTAVLPTVPAALAVTLSGFAGAAALLAELHGNQFFIERRADLPSTYDYHPLFRQFLLAQAQAALPAGELARVRIHAAELLEQSGEIEAAATERR
ncbi:MAG: hypothetical protein ABI624_17630 [Casimicrobiaceae bacterium]